MEPIGSLGARVRHVREARGVTLASLADTCRVSEGAIRQIETGAVERPSLLLGLRIANALGVEPYWLGTGEATPLDVRVVELEARVSALEKSTMTASPR
jgi:transcriptional regulator with XRE-family HTH domain